MVLTKDTFTDEVPSWYPNWLLSITWLLSLKPWNGLWSTINTEHAAYWLHNKNNEFLRKLKLKWNFKKSDSKKTLLSLIKSLYLVLSFWTFYFSMNNIQQYKWVHTSNSPCSFWRCSRVICCSILPRQKAKWLDFKKKGVLRLQS